MSIQLLSPISVHPHILPRGSYYVIENFPFPYFIQDEKGIPISFETFAEAADEAMQCQNGFVITFNT